FSPFFLRNPPPPASPPAEPPIVTTASGLRFQILQPGTGRRPTRADAAVVTYQVRLAADGRVVEQTAAPAGVPVAGSIPGFTEAAADECGRPLSFLGAGPARLRPSRQSRHGPAR